MLLLLFLVLGTPILYCIINWSISFHRNLQTAKQSGIHYIAVPVESAHRLWLIAHPLVLHLLKRLPDEYTAWVDYVIPIAGQSYGHEIFQRIGHDTFLAVSPGGITMYTCEPAVITQITSRRNDFPKPIKKYAVLDIYGKNVVTTEGHTWRRHRKAVSPSFTEKNNQAVWLETIDEAGKMLQSWVGEGGRGDRPVERVMDDTMRLSLHVISQVGFGRKIEWPKGDGRGQTGNEYSDPSKIQNDEGSPDHGHRMTYTYAIHVLLDNVLLALLLPRWLLKWIPVSQANKVGEAYREWGAYMKEMIASKQETLEQGLDTKETDIIGQLVKEQMKDGSNEGNGQLTDMEILGNLFVLMIAGHETSANSIHFTMIYMALYPKSQRLLQKDLDNIFQGRPPSQWSYDRDFPALIGGMAGAVLNEELRLLPAATNIPKSTLEVGDQQLLVEGKPCTVPGGSLIELLTPGAHRNAKHWPTGAPTYPGGKTAHPRTNLDNDLEEFRPERWLLNENDPGRQHVNSHDYIASEESERDSGGSESADYSDHLFKPAPGVFFPFSEGHRACLGRRFAQVEVLAAIAVIFQNYSVELAVDKYASDEELVRMDTSERADAWQKAAEDARELLLTGLAVMITLQMRAGHVKLRLRPRGNETFPENVDDIWKRNHPDLCSASGLPTWKAWKGPKFHGAG